jgi:hypothetical protein
VRARVQGFPTLAMAGALDFCSKREPLNHGTGPLSGSMVKAVYAYFLGQLGTAGMHSSYEQC